MCIQNSQLTSILSQGSSISTSDGPLTQTYNFCILSTCNEHQFSDHLIQQSNAWMYQYSTSYSYLIFWGISIFLIPSLSLFASYLQHKCQPLHTQHSMGFLLCNIVLPDNSLMCHFCLGISPCISCSYIRIR